MPKEVRLEHGKLLIPPNIEDMIKPKKLGSKFTLQTHMLDGKEAVMKIRMVCYDNIAPKELIFPS